MDSGVKIVDRLAQVATLVLAITAVVLAAVLLAKMSSNVTTAETLAVLTERSQARLALKFPSQSL